MTWAVDYTSRRGIFQDAEFGGVSQLMGVVKQSVTMAQCTSINLLAILYRQCEYRPICCYVIM